MRRIFFMVLLLLTYAASGAEVSKNESVPGWDSIDTSQDCGVILDKSGPTAALTCVTNKLVAMQQQMESLDNSSALKEELVVKLSAQVQALQQQAEEQGKQFSVQIQALQQQLAAQKNLTPDQLHAEARYTQTITIGGSKDLMYPVWWRFPNNSFGLGRITVHRNFATNEDTRPLESNQPHQAALLLEIEGNGNPWDGDANFLEIKRYSTRYNDTVSHIRFNMYAQRESADGINPPDYGADGTNYRYSGMYLRGGGLTYHITKNWPEEVQYLNGADPKAQVTLHVYQNSLFFVKPIPWANKELPNEDVNAFVDPPTP